MIFTRKNLVSMFTLGSVLLLPSIAGADVYRWKDSQGQVHFGDLKPSHVGSYQKMAIRETNSFGGGDKVKQGRSQATQYSLKTENTQVQEHVQTHLSGYCKKAENKYLGLMGAVPLYNTRFVVRENGKAVSRRKQNEIAEDYRQNVNHYGCDIAQI